MIREMNFLGDYCIHPVQYLFTAFYYTVNMPCKPSIYILYTLWYILYMKNRVQRMLLVINCKLFGHIASA